MYIKLIRWQREPYRFILQGSSKALDSSQRDNFFLYFYFAKSFYFRFYQFCSIKFEEMVNFSALYSQQRFDILVSAAPLAALIVIGSASAAQTVQFYSFSSIKDKIFQIWIQARLHFLFFKSGSSESLIWAPLLFSLLPCTLAYLSHQTIGL